MKTSLCILTLLALAQVANAQQFAEKISKELSFEKTTNRTLMIFNISGDVRVTGYDGDRILIEVERVVTAKTDRRLEIGKQQLQLGIKDRADTVLLYIEGLCSEFGKQTDRRHWNNNRKTNGWGYLSNDRNNRNECEEAFDHEMNFVIKVPVGVNIYASTINNGDVVIDRIAGQVSANNINGSITLNDISGQTFASTINGGVTLEYAKNPLAECRYYSLNGDITASFKKGLTANVAFESFNGNMYSNIDRLESMPSVMETTKGRDGLKSKLGNNRFKVGQGGVLLDFETFNGNVYLKEN